MDIAESFMMGSFYAGRPHQVALLRLAAASLPGLFRTGKVLQQAKNPLTVTIALFS
jgi:hypothetical protein